MRTTLILLAALTLATTALAQTPGDAMKPAPQPRPYCLGRFLIDLPPDAEIVAQTAEYRGDKIEVKRQPLAEGFQRMIAEKENTLRETKHEKEPSLLKYVSKNDDGTSVAIIYWKTPEKRHLYETEVHKWQKGFRFLAKGQADPDRMEMAIDFANRSLSELRYRDPQEIPGEPGFCIERGLFAGEPAMPHYEYAYVHFRLKTHPDVIVTISTSTVMKEEGEEGLLDRLDRKSKESALIELFKKVKTLRRGQHPVGSIAAEEDLSSVPTGETFSTHIFRWEAPGKYRGLYAPEITVEFESGKINIGGYSRPSVTDKQAIELFDSIVNSIRARPVSAPPAPKEPLPAPSRPQAALPLGTTRASGERCGQDGVWECATPLASHAFGGPRRYFTAGQALPTVIVRGPERSLWQKLRGEPANVLAPATWTLVSYDAPQATGKTEESGAT